MSRVFNGTSDLITLATSATLDSLAAALTVEAWIKVTNISATTVVSFGGGAHEMALANQGPSSADLQARIISTGGVAQSFTGNLPITYGVWYHVALTWNGAGDGVVRLYIDGVEVTYDVANGGGPGVTIGTLINPTGFSVVLGTDQFGSFFKGSIQGFRAYNAAASAAQIVSAKGSNCPTVPSALSANIKTLLLLGGTQSPEPDASGNGNVGILTGTTGSADNPPVSPLNYSVPDCRNYAAFPNSSRNVNCTLIYDVQTSSNSIIPPTDSRAAGKPVVCGTYPQNSRTSGTFGPGE